jgi:hypothetical protein
MKKLLCYLFPAAVICLVLASCRPDDGGEERDEALLYGKWLLTFENGKAPTVKQEYWIYYADGNGKTWDESEDITEAEAQSFTWTLVKSELTRIHVTEMVPDPNGGTRAGIPKVYEVTELTATTLSYEDALGYSATFTKQ